MQCVYIYTPAGGPPGAQHIFKKPYYYYWIFSNAAHWIVSNDMTFSSLKSLSLHVAKHELFENWANIISIYISSTHAGAAGHHGHPQLKCQFVKVYVPCSILYCTCITETARTISYRSLTRCHIYFSELTVTDEVPTGREWCKEWWPDGPDVAN